MRLTHQKKENSCNPKLRLIACGFLFFGIGIFLGWKNIPGFIKGNFVLLTEPRIIDALTQENNLDTINLDISFKNLQKIENKRSEAIKKERLISSDDDFVKAEISHNGQKYKCKVRLKGDLPDHWSGEKFSLRVEMKSAALLKGMSKFSLQDPATRIDTEEWLFLETLRQEGCIAVRYDFVNLIINGKKMGIYAIEEHFSKELIEANERREGVIVNFDDYYVWKKAQPQFAGNISWDSIYRSSPAKVRNKKKVLSSPSLAKQAENAINLLRILQSESLPASKIFDVEKIGKFFAITHIWEANHGLGLDDINFYFNPVTSLLEPIGFDAEPSFYSHFCLFTSGGTKDTWFNYCLKDTNIASSYLKHLEMYSRNDFFLDLKRNLFQYEANIRGLLLAEFLWDDPTTIWKNANKIFKYDPWVNLNDRIARIREELQEERPLHAYCRLIDTGSNKIEICLRNSTSYPSEILSLSYLGEDFEPKEFIIEGKIRINPLTEKLYLPSHKNGTLQLQDDLKFILDLPNHNNISPITSEFTIKSRFLGTNYTEKNSSFSIDKYSFSFSEIPLKNQKLSLHNIPYSISEDGKIISIKSGAHNVDNNIFIPSGFIVIIKPDTSFLFSSNATFVSQSIIHAIGNADHPINFTSQDTSKLWPGILLYSAQKDYSYFEHVIFKNVGGVGKGSNKNGINRNGWTMTGGVTVHNSSVNFLDCHFENFESEDALNIISSDFSLINTTFNNVVSDAFDGDFVRGKVSNCKFSKVQGDGADFSGSEVEIVDSQFNEIFDKAISVGENSRAKILNSKITNVSFGVVSKDHSVTEVGRETVVDNAKIAAFSAFQKKPLFGPATLRVKDSFIKSSAKDFWIQEGSSSWNNGIPINTSKFSTEKIYESNFTSEN